MAGYRGCIENKQVDLDWFERLERCLMFKAKRILSALLVVFVATGCAVQTVNPQDGSLGVPATACAPMVTPIGTGGPNACISCAPPRMQVCAGCNAVQVVHAYAVARPADCNDFPVTYRVQIPDPEVRVRSVESYAR